MVCKLCINTFSHPIVPVSLHSPGIYLHITMLEKWPLPELRPVLHMTFSTYGSTEKCVEVFRFSHSAWKVLICQENSILIKIWQKNNGFFAWRWMYIFGHISILRIKMFLTKVVEKVKTCIVVSPPKKPYRLWGNVEKWALEVTDGSMEHPLYVLDN